MKKINLSIKRQLSITFIIISSLIIFVVTSFNFTSNVNQKKNSFVQNSLIEAKLLAEFSVTPLIFSDEYGAKEILEKLEKDNNIVRVIVFDNKGRIFAQHNPFNLHSPKEIQEKEYYFDENNNNKFLDYGILKITTPLQHNGSIHGKLYIEKSTKIITELLEKVFYDVIVFTLILLVIIYIISVLLSNYLLKPILHLANIAEEIAISRNYSTRVSYDSTNEIGSMYKSFNSLIMDIEKSTENLESQVEYRTKELNEKTRLLEESINELKKAQSHLIESEKLSALGNLVSGIAHEVNTPLGNAITSSSIIRKESKHLITQFHEGTLKRSVMESRLEVLNESSKLLHKTLQYASNMIKSFKQISVDQVTNDVRSIDIKKYIEEIFLTNHNKLKLIPVKVNIICNTEELMIKTSAGVFAQIFNNLIQNSILHGFEDNKENAKINVYLKEENQRLIIIYEDNGKGVHPSIKDKIFEPFVTTKRNNGGTGLGLNIVYNLVTQKLKGSLGLDSIEGIDTRFTINIPSINSNEEEI